MAPKAPPVRRERPRPPMPPGPPWKLVSPFGVLHILEDEGAIALLAKTEGLSVFDVRHLLELEQGNTTRPMHV